MIINLQRDGVFLDPAQQTFQFASEVAIGNYVDIEGDPTVYDDYSTVLSDYTTNPGTTAGNWRAVGCYIRPPGVDRTPYRIKANMTNDSDLESIVGIGFGPTSPTGSGDRIQPVRPMPFYKRFDDVIMLPAVPETDPNYGKPLCVCLIIQGSNAGGTKAYGNLSVQRLATAPPTFAQSVS